MGSLDNDFANILKNLSNIRDDATAKLDTFNAGDFDEFETPASVDAFQSLENFDTGNDGWDINASLSQPQQPIDYLNTDDIGMGAGASSYGQAGYNTAEGLNPRNIQHMVTMVGKYIEIGMLVEDATLLALRHFLDDFNMIANAQTITMSAQLADQYRNAHTELM